jgi:putative tricarboxylic transport membrane protein
MSMPERPLARADRSGLAVAGFLAALAVLVGWDASQLSAAQTYARIGPQAFPYAIALGLLVLAAATAINALRHWLPAPREEPAPVLWILGGFIAQIVLVGFAGFSIATGALFAATARAFGRGPLVATFPLGVALALGLWILFAKGLDLALPSGPLERLF